MENDSFAHCGDVVIDSFSYSLKGLATLKASEQILDDNFNRFQFIEFVRNPYDRLVSSYNFYKKGGKNNTLTKNKIKRIIHKLKYILARILPFGIWIFVFPYKSNYEFLVDDDGKVLANHIGVYERLNEDLVNILLKINLNFNVSTLRYLNESKGNKYTSILKNKGIQSLLKLRHSKFQKDIDFYNNIIGLDKKFLRENT